MLIGDEPTTQSLERQLLEEAAWEVVEAFDELEGLPAHDRCGPEVVIVDVTMDDME